jgi:hypothetical protein
MVLTGTAENANSIQRVSQKFAALPKQQIVGTVDFANFVVGGSASLLRIGLTLGCLEWP